ncbi:MAG: DUF4350 domain-containing protein [Streptomycetales bacterium]
MTPTGTGTMSGTMSGTATPAPASSTDPTSRQVWRAVRGPLAVALVVLLVGASIGYLQSQSRRGLLDPRAVDPSGSRALARLLDDQGVQVDVVHTTAAASAGAGGESTLFVPFPHLLQRQQLEAVARAYRHIVVVAPTSDALEVLAPGLEASGEAAVAPHAPACRASAAQRAGEAHLGGTLYSTEKGAGGSVRRCYPVDGRPSLLVLEEAGRRTVVVGTAGPFTNRRLADLGNAALTLRLLGERPHLVWYLPSLADASRTPDRSFEQLIPAAWKWAFLQVVVGVALLALWRTRRLGPIVMEPLPVVVRSAETVEGLARLYRRGRARGRAAGALRAATLARVVPLVGLPRQAHAPAVVDALAARTGRPEPAVAALLYGAVPGDDSALARLADDLDVLEREVRAS